MSWVYRRLIRPLLFEQNSEAIHDRTISMLRRISRSEMLCDAVSSFCGAPALPIEVFGLRFPNPVGLAAGMDKSAAAVPAWAGLGFGFAELGGVTWHAQPGNPRPRIFRAIDDEALVNRMGFNNPGADAVARELADWRTHGRWPAHPIGINLGKSKVTPLEDAADDYANSFRVLWPFADFFVVNVSSPNTPNLRQLQDKAALNAILERLQEINREMSGQRSRVGGSEHPERGELQPMKPILVKVAPDLSFEALDEILELAEPRELAGVVATNTTICRPESVSPELRAVYTEAGGLSGKPLRSRSTEVIRHLYRQTRGSLPIVGVGGIFTADDAWEKITAGASLVQIYTGLVYEGPTIAREIVTGLIEKLAEERLSSIREAVGIQAM